MILLEPGRTPFDLRFSLFGIPVRVHPFAWVVAFLLAYPPDGRAPLDVNLFLYVMTGAFAILCCILAHELGHAVTQRGFGDRGNRIVVYYFGGLAIGARDPPGVARRLIVLAAGPGAGFLLAGVAYGALRFWQNQAESFAGLGAWVYLKYALGDAVWIGVVWGLFNLVPVFPLDGGQMLRETLVWKRGARGEYLAVTASFYVAAAAAAGCLAWRIWGGPATAQMSALAALVFATLAFSNHLLRRQLAAHGGGYEPDEPRAPWENDPDWWRRGRS